MSAGDGDQGPGVILVVDDDDGVRRGSERYLVRLGYRVLTASNAAEAIAWIDRQEVDVLVTDLRMPGGSGLDLLLATQARAPLIRTILISGKADTTDAATAIDRGIDRLLLKPFGLEELRSSVEKSLAEKRAQERAAREQEAFEALVHQREKESRTWTIRAAHALIAAVEAKDAYTAGHASRVTSYSSVLAQAVSGIDMERFKLAGDLHDVGKIGVPDAVLNKPGRLTSEEFELVKKHPLLGVQILEPLLEDPMVLGVVRWHHEKWDGSGYPDALAAEEVPLPARVLAIGDTLDAMTSSRAYRDHLPWETAVAEIQRCAGTHFDPQLVAAFSSVLPELKALHSSHRQANA